MITKPSRNSEAQISPIALMICSSFVFGAGHETCAAETQPADSGMLDEVIVTAEKRSGNLQDTPITVNAFDAATLGKAGITSTADLGVLTPGLEFGNQIGYGQPHLRGVGTLANGPGVENPVALYVDGVYYGAMAGSTLALNNISDIEVLKGPQGTLFGRNATGGLIQVTTKDPQQSFSGDAALTYGNYDTWGTDFYMTGGLSAVLAADVAVHFMDQGTGYGTNAFNGLDVNKNQDLAVRSKWLMTPVAGTEFKLIADYERSTSIPALVPAPGTTPLGGPPYTGPAQGLDGYFQPHGVNDGGGLSLRAEQDLGFAQLVSTTAYRKSSMDMSFDGALVTDPGYALNIEIWEKHQQFTQEFQLAAPTDSALKWIAGLFFYDADGQFAPISVTGGLLAPVTFVNTNSDQRAVSVAGYAQATKEVADATNLTMGLRYTWERRKFHNSEIVGFSDVSSQFFEGGDASVTYTKPTWRLSIDHRFSPDLLAYVSYNRGFKSGGFNDGLVPTTAYAPEVLDAYELGLKMDLLDRRLRVDAAGFLYNYKNIQAVRYPNGLEVIYNGASARLYGLDLDLTAKLAPHLDLTAGVELLHSAFTSFPSATFSSPAAGGGTNFSTFDATGNQLGEAPKLTWNVGLNYAVPTSSGEIAVTGIYAYNSGWYPEPDNRLHQPSYGLVNAQTSWTSVSTVNKVTLWGKNLRNTQYTTALASQSNGDYAVYAPPRTYGITIERRF